MPISALTRSSTNSSEHTTLVMRWPVMVLERAGVEDLARMVINLAENFEHRGLGTLDDGVELVAHLVEAVARFARPPDRRNLAADFLSMLEQADKLALEGTSTSWFDIVSPPLDIPFKSDSCP